MSCIRQRFQRCREHRDWIHEMSPLWAENDKFSILCLNLHWRQSERQAISGTALPYLSSPCSTFSFRTISYILSIAKDHKGTQHTIKVCLFIVVLFSHPSSSPCHFTILIFFVICAYRFASRITAKQARRKKRRIKESVQCRGVSFHNNIMRWNR